MATLSQAGIYGVGNGILMPKQKNKWNVTFVGMGRNSGNPLDISMQVKSCSRPKISWEEVVLDRYNSRSYIAGKHTWDPLNLVIEDDVTNKASTMIQRQLEAQQRLIGADGPWLNTEATASTYKFATIISQLDGNEGILEQWRCQGCFVSNIDYDGLDYSDSSALTINLTIRFDHAQQIIAPNSLGTAIGGL